MTDEEWAAFRDRASAWAIPGVGTGHGPSPSTPASTDRVQPDPVTHPPHYTQGGIECIDAMRAALGEDGFRAYCRGAAIKYLWRGPHKSAEAEDYRKALFYVRLLSGDDPR